MKAVIAVLALTAACGDNRTLADAAAGDDASTTPPRAIVVAGDFTAGHPGVLSVLDMTTRQMTTNVAPAGSVDSDPVLRKIGGELFVVNRSANNVTILNANDFSLVEQIGTGAGSNPQDVAIKGDKLYVPVFLGSGVAVLTRGSISVASIDLSADDPDGKPNCISAAIAGDDLYVVCELLDASFKARGPGKVYVIDTTSDTVQTAKTMTLTYKNPFGMLETIPDGAPMAGDLVIPSVGDFPFSLSVGCIERITPGASPVAAGCLPTDADLQGVPNRVAIQKIGIGMAIMWIATAAPDFSAQRLRAFDLMSKMLWADPITPASQTITDVAVCPNDALVVCDSTANASGLRIYENATETSTMPFATGISFCSAHGLVCY